MLVTAIIPLPPLLEQANILHSQPLMDAMISLSDVQGTAGGLLTGSVTLGDVLGHGAATSRRTATPITTFSRVLQKVEATRKGGATANSRKRVIGGNRVGHSE